MPPDMMGKDYDESEIIREGIEARKDPFEHKVDHKEDKTAFEIALINKRNAGLVLTCAVSNGKIDIDRVKFLDKDAVKMA